MNDDTQPIVGGDTAVTLSSAATLESLGVTVAPLGLAALDTSGTDPVADFPITGGTAGPGSDAVLLHQGSGLELSGSAGTLDLQDFRIDTQNGVVDANVTVNGESAGNVAVFAIGADGATLTLTPAAAEVVDQTLGTTAITSDAVIGSAAPSPVTDFCAIDWADVSAGDVQSIIGGDTAVTVTAAGTMQSLGISLSPLGSASVDASGANPVADFPITGGTAGPGGDLLLLHQGSGLALADGAGSIDLRDFLIDTQNGVVDANVSANGQFVGNLPVFNIGPDGATLTLTPAAAGLASDVLGTGALSSDVVIGTAAPSPSALA